MGVNGLLRLASRRLIRLTLLGVWVGGLSLNTLASEEQSLPERAHDLVYGEALFEYHQGNAFAALTQLALGEAKGGIEGHGDHPALLEGGIMLGFGMPESARAVFERLLAEHQEPETASVVWFYLGKGFYLERNFELAGDALSRVDADALERARPELVTEWHYLQGQAGLALNDQERLDEALSALSENEEWGPYLAFNQALSAAIDPAGEGASAEHPALSRALLIQDLSLPVAEDGEELSAEMLAFTDRVNMTEAAYRLDGGDYDGAMRAFRRIRINGPLSDQALYGFALAATESQQFGLALEALNTLSARPLFNPWLRQVPYARAYLLEAMKQPEKALLAYAEAVEAYQGVLKETESVLANLTEETLLASLEVPGENGEEALSLLEASEAPQDSFGRFNVQPRDFRLARRISTEAFQLALRDLFELRRMQSELERWRGQTETYRLMLETRQALKAQKGVDTQAVLSSQNAESLEQQRVVYEEALQQAVEQEDAIFFLDEEQLEYHELLAAARERVERLPAAEQAEFHEKLERAERYFTWWAHDRYGVNRWAAQKQLKGLNAATEEFQQRREQLLSLLSSDTTNEALAVRLAEAEARIERLGAALDGEVTAALDRLMGMVRKDLKSQQSEVRQYAQAAQKARARLLDEAFDRQGGVL